MLNFLLTAAPFARSLWDSTTKDLAGLLFVLAVFLLPLLILTAVLYLAGRLVVGGRRARFSDAFLIAFLGTIIGTITTLFISSFLLLIVIQIIVWLALIKHFYETGWLGALAVAVLSLVVFIVIVFILSLVFAISFVFFENQTIPLFVFSLL